MTGKRKVKNMSPQQRAAAMISVRKQHGRRTPRVRSMDARQTANRVIDPDTDNLYPWQRHPNRCDVGGGALVAKKPNVAKSATVEKLPEPKNWTVVEDVEEMEGQPGVYFRVEAYGGAEADIDKMRSVIGADQIDDECYLCGAKMDLGDLETGCPECGGEASQNNRYAKMIDDFDLIPNDEGDYELPGLLAFENHSAAYEYAQNVPGGEIVAYKGEELYYGMQEPDTAWDEFLINPKIRFRDASNISMKKV